MSWTALVQPALEWAWRLLGVATAVRVRTHLGEFPGTAGLPGRAGRAALFVNVANVSLSQEVEITHVWVDTSQGQVAPGHSERPLPVRLKPRQSWETWIDFGALMDANPANADQLVRVRLSDGRVAKGKPDRSIPHAGHVAGGSAGGSPGGEGPAEEKRR